MSDKLQTIPQLIDTFTNKEHILSKRDKQITEISLPLYKEDIRTMKLSTVKSNILITSKLNENIFSNVGEVISIVSKDITTGLRSPFTLDTTESTYRDISHVPQSTSYVFEARSNELLRLSTLNYYLAHTASTKPRDMEATIPYHFIGETSIYALLKQNVLTTILPSHGIVTTRISDGLVDAQVPKRVTVLSPRLLDSTSQLFKFTLSIVHKDSAYMSSIVQLKLRNIPGQLSTSFLMKTYSNIDVVTGVMLTGELKTASLSTIKTAIERNIDTRTGTSIIKTNELQPILPSFKIISKSDILYSSKHSIALSTPCKNTKIMRPYTLISHTPLKSVLTLNILATNSSSREILPMEIIGKLLTDHISSSNTTISKDVYTKLDAATIIYDILQITPQLFMPNPISEEILSTAYGDSIEIYSAIYKEGRTVTLPFGTSRIQSSDILKQHISSTLANEFPTATSSTFSSAISIN